MTPTGTPDLVERVDALLPQTQCTRCGYAGCRPYAQALAGGTAAINRCPPGGKPVISGLARLFDVPELPLDASCGSEELPQVAWIDEPACIGCAKCIDVCPTDAISGARKWMHTVIAADCTGCGLCLPACPVDCISLLPAPGQPERPLDGAAIARRAAHYRRLYEARQRRLLRNDGRRRTARQARLGAAPGPGEGGPP